MRAARPVCTLVAALLSTMALVAQKPAPEPVSSFGMVGDHAGWAVEAHHLFWTDALGASWKEITPNAAATLSSATFTTPMNGWAAEFDGAQILIARTTDGGAHWTEAPVSVPFSSAQSPNGASSLSFADTQHGFLMIGLQSSTAFRQGILLSTADGGRTWSALPAPPAGGDIRFTDALHGFDGPGPAGDELFRTGDGGQTWQRVSLPSTADLALANSRVGLPTFTSATAGTLDRTFDNNVSIHYTTDDGGETWTASAPGIAASAPARSVFGSATNGFGLFSEGHCDKDSCTQTTALRATRDAGESYIDVAPANGVALTAKRTQDAPSIAHPDSSSVYNTAGVMGFDACSLPTTAQMQDWITNSPYRVAGMYIGGTNYANCTQSLSKLNTAWVSTVQGMGWQLIPIWVGPQGPGACSNKCSNLSTDPATAQGQGSTEADSALAALTALGIGQGTPIVYDMEAYTRNATNEAATTAFLSGWAAELHAKGFLAAAYSSHPEFTDWYSLAPEYATKPAAPVDTIWFAYFFSSGACGATCQTVFPTQSSFDISTSYWLNNHRMRQTSSGFNSTYGATTINIDEDWIDAAMVTPTPNFVTLDKKGTGTVASTTLTNNNGDTTTYTGISCGAGCTTATAYFAPTDTVVLAGTVTGGQSLSWHGCTSTSGNNCTIATTAPSLGLIASFGYTLSVGSSTATVTSDDRYINCGSTCSFAYPTGSTVYLTAKVPAGSSITGWTGCAGTSATCAVLIGTTPLTVTPIIVANPGLTVTKTGTGTGTITSADSNINCGTTCTFGYPAGTTVVLTAAAASGSTFTSWSGCTTSTANTCTVTTGSAAAAVTATFTLNPVLTVTKAGTGSGTVASSDSTINCGSTCSASYAPGSTVLLTATAASGSVFGSWTGCTTSSGATCTITVGTAAIPVTATFNPAPSFSSSASATSLTVSAGSTGTDTINLVTTNGWTGTFSNFACSGQPATVTCSFSPGSANVSTNTTTPITLTVTVPSTISALRERNSTILFAGLALPLTLLPLAFGKRRTRRWLTLAMVAAAALATQGLTGCGGSGSTATHTPTTTTVFTGTMNVTFTSTPTGGTATTNTVPIALTVTKTS